MADFEGIQRSLADVKSDLKGIGLEMQRTDKYTKGFRKTMSDLASMKEGQVAGTLWSALTRLSAGIPAVYKTLNQLRSVTVFFRLFSNIEKKRNNELERQNGLIEEQLSNTDKMVGTYKSINDLIEKSGMKIMDNSIVTEQVLTLEQSRIKQHTKLNLMSDEYTRFKLKEVGMEEYLLTMQKASERNVKNRLATERKIIQELGQGYKLTENNAKIIEETFGKTAGLGRLLAGTGKFTDAFKDVGKDIVSPGGLLQQLFDPTFYETKEIAQQFLVLKEEVQVFSDMFEEENKTLKEQKKIKRNLQIELNGLERKALKRETEKAQLRERRKNLAAETGEDADYLGKINEQRDIEYQISEAKARMKELDAEMRTPSARMEMDTYKPLQAKLEDERRKLQADENRLLELSNYIETRKIEIRGAAIQTSEELAKEKEEIDERLNEILEDEIKAKQERAKKQKQLDKIDFKNQEELVKSIKEQEELRTTEKNMLEADLEERGVSYDEGKDALSFPTGIGGKLKQRAKAFKKLSRGKQAKEVIKKLGLPLTGLFTTVKGAFMAYLTKKNFNKIFMMAGLSIKVFAQILYAITLIGLLVYILHKSGFIDGVRAFVEKYQEEITNYFNILFMFFTGLFEFIKGAAKIVYGLFTGNSKIIGEGFEELLDGLGKIIMGAIGGIIGFFGGIFLMTMSGIIEGVGGKLIGRLDTVAENVGGLIGKASGMLSGGLAGAKLGAAIGTFFAPGIGTVIGGVLGGVIGTVAGGSLGTGIGNYVGDKLGLPGYASGGMVSNTGLALVGERGPEIVNLPAGARVYNNQQSRSMMGGNTINVSVNGRVGASDAELDDLARKLGRKINLEMNRYNNSGYRA